MKTKMRVALLAMALATSRSVALAQDKTVAGASATATGDLLVFYWTPQAQDLQIVNISFKPRQKVVGPVVRWQTPEGLSLVDHVAAVSSTGDLLIFVWPPDAGSEENWRLVNVSDNTQAKVVGPLSTWQTPDGPFTVDHVAAVSPDGDLMVFFSSTQAGSEESWQVINVSGQTQQKIAGPLTTWQTTEGSFNVEHVAGANTAGDLVVFSWSPATDWQVVNVSIKLKSGLRVRLAVG